MVYKFYGFLLLQGFLMPTFNDFGYYFAIDVLHISKEFLCVVPIFCSVFVIFNPLLYQKIWSKLEFTTLFVASQIITIVQNACGLFLISKYELLHGSMPMLAFYVMT